MDIHEIFQAIIHPIYFFRWLKVSMKIEKPKRMPFGAFMFLCKLHARHK